MAAAAHDRNQSLGAAACWSGAQRETCAHWEADGGARYDCGWRVNKDHGVQRHVLLRRDVDRGGGARQGYGVGACETRERADDAQTQPFSVVFLTGRQKRGAPSMRPVKERDCGVAGVVYGTEEE
jgi:hypothetical protein